MTNLNTELNFNELDVISGGTGAFGGVLEYVKAYVAALGTAKLGSMYDGTGTGSGGVNDTGSGSGGGGCPGGCHGIT